ncbi:MAG: alkaline phosphatase family protein [Alphaproteobacteria bacterium]|nr:alkaline phosphatase family protein [Alphaproteobacteria bacterium]
MSLLLLSLLACRSGPEHKLVVMGIDGLEWSMVDRLAEAGEMPNLSRLREQGIRGTVENTAPVMSPILWTTIASGYPGEVHGIGGWTTGGGHSYDAADVRVMRIWDLASREGVESLVIGWLMSFPSSPIVGRMVSDRYVWSFPMNKNPDDPSVLVYQAEHEEMSGLVSPPSLDATIAPLLPEDAWLTAHPRVGYQIEEYGSPFHPLRRDELHLRIFERLWPDSDASLGMLYLNGPDQVSHIYWPYADPEVAQSIRRDPLEHQRQINAERGPENLRRAAPFSQHPITPEELALGARFVPDYYRYIDDAVGRVLEAVDLDDTTLLICSDHGFRPSMTNPMANGGHTREAAVLFVGAGVNPEARIPEGATVLDLGPTLYALLDLPGAEDWTGQALSGLFEDLPAPAPEPSHQLTDRAQIAVELGTQANPQLMEQLEALGYIDGEGKPILGASRGAGQ